ncbi:DUF262 domain-containing protein [Streptomyces sp. NPDC000927]|uniref:DUF262 domain-containing protein n=1 Tax=Streptomyces sp. NPDC000927 TaxID=3154371 RepID=UPI0033333E28
MTRQTTSPLVHLGLSVHDRQVRELSRQVQDPFGLDLNPPYQRGQVWSADQKVALVRSWLTGIPTGVVILNDRSSLEWEEGSGYDPITRGEASYACIDGKQRISAGVEWFDDQFAVPASWFEAKDVTSAEETDDGPYVRWSGLTVSRQRIFANRARLGVATARAATVVQEAGIYLLVNGGGTPQTPDDMVNAERVFTRDGASS